jgi:hypothetical protein
MYKLDGSDPTRHRTRAGVARQVSTRWDAASASAGPAGSDAGVEERAVFRYMLAFLYNHSYNFLVEL